MWNYSQKGVESFCSEASGDVVEVGRVGRRVWTELDKKRFWPVLGKRKGAGQKKAKRMIGSDLGKIKGGERSCWSTVNKSTIESQLIIADVSHGFPYNLQEFPNVLPRYSLKPKFVLLEFWIFFFSIHNYKDVLTENRPRLDARSECTNSQQCTALIWKQNVRWRNFSQKLIFTGEVKHWTSLMFAPLRLACQIMFDWSNKCLHLGNQMKIKVTLESTLNGFQSQLDCSYGTLSLFLCRLQNF